MTMNKSTGILVVMLAVTALVSVSTASEEVAYKFSGGKDGYYPWAGMTADASGNVYGVTVYGGAHGAGAVFRVTPKSGGGWKEKVLHSFQGVGKEGYYPYGVPLVDAAGNIYGTTYSGGAHGYGIVYQLQPSGSGKYSRKVVHSFSNNGKDGLNPYAGVSMDAAGNLYGTTSRGGAFGYGAAYQIAPKVGGGWTYTVLHSFNNDGTDGYYPYSGLISDGSGNLYGTNYVGCKNGLGCVYQLSQSGGKWSEKILHNFANDGTDGYYPYGGLIFDGNGNLLGTAFYGGAHSGGVVFQLKPKGKNWTEKILYSFNPANKDGSGPYLETLVLDAAGDIFGTTYVGGLYGYGTVFELTPHNNGYKEKLLHSFNNDGTDGDYPYAGVTLDSAGNILGTTPGGGAGYGVVYAISQ